LVCIKSVIIVLNIILDSLLKWFAPILSFTTEEIFRHVCSDKKSIHLEKFKLFPQNLNDNNIYDKWSKLIKIRDICNLSIEQKRADKVIGSSLEAYLEIILNKENFDLFKNIDFAELCITSSAIIKQSDESNFDKTGVRVNTFKAEGEKCLVCWKVDPKPCSRHGQNTC